MALSTTRTLLTQTGINTHQVFDIGGLDSVGVATFSNFKTGLSNLHSIGFDGSNRRIELPLSVAEEIAEEIDVPIMMVEVHPTHERLEVSSVYLNDKR